jgi:hypothetical protein
MRVAAAALVVNLHGLLVCDEPQLILQLTYTTLALFLAATL